MARQSDDQNAFNSGELSPLLLGRQDLAKYKSGEYTCLNGVPLTQGAWTRRPGTAFLHQTKFQDKLSRLIPFQYSITQTYMLEFGEQYVRFYTNHGIVTQTPQNVTGVTKANPAVLTYAGADTYANADRVVVTGMTGGMTQLNNREFIVANVNAGANTFELKNTDGTNVDSTGYDTFSAGGTVAEIYEVPTAFDDTDLAQIRVTQSADTLYVLHPDFPPATLVRTSALTWTYSDLQITEGPYDSTNTTTTTLTPSAFAVGTGVTLTASSTTGINLNTGFKVTDIGRFIRMQQGTVWGYAVITGFTDTTHVTVTVLSTLTSTAAKTAWRLGIWSDTTGWPATGTFHEDRLWMGGAALYPQRIDGSKSGNYVSFEPSSLAAGVVADDNAIAYTLNSDDVNAIRWMSSNEKALLVGTSRSEWAVRASTATAPLTPTDISAKPSTHYGSEDTEAVSAGRAVLFIQRAGRKIRELAYVFEIDGFRAPDLTILSQHITLPSVTAMAYQEQPQPVIWFVRSDGALIGLSYERDQDVVAWHRHILGGSSDAAGLEIPVVESVAVIPSPDTLRDELYLIVQRYVNGGVKRYVEYVTKLWEIGDDQEDAFHADCGWTQIDSPATNEISGLWHLEGQTVGIYADGAKVPLQTVTNGKLTLTGTASVKTVGYWYNSDLVTMPLDGGAQDGAAQGKIKKISRIGFWLVDTLGLKYGPSFDKLTELIVRKWGDVWGVVSPLYTGVVRKRFEGSYDLLAQVYVRCDGPFPCTMLSLMPQYETSDDS